MSLIETRTFTYMLGDQLNQLWPPAAFPVIASLGLKCIGAAAEKEPQLGDAVLLCYSCFCEHNIILRLGA